MSEADISEWPEQSHPRVMASTNSIPLLTSLDISTLPMEKVSKFYLAVTSNALGTVNVPVFAFRSARKGPVFGITCAIHGNEVNGIPVIQKLFEDIDTAANNNTNSLTETLRVDCGTVIGIPVVNVPGFLASIRCFDDESKQDLNRLMPGKAYGAAPQQYAYAIFNEIITKFDYVVDLHTASAGRRNSLYVRADMNEAHIAKLAHLMQPQVLVHVATQGSLRGCAQARGIYALTVEIGSPSVFQPDFFLATYAGIRRLIASIGMSQEYTPGIRTIQAIREMQIERSENTIVCTKSFWIFSKTGGILKVFKDIAQRVHPGELIAEVQTIFGESVEQIFAPDFELVVVGVEGNPVAKTGNRVVHLGIIGEDFSGPPGDDGHL